MASRSRDAVSTIKGYYYQFDYFILQLLHLQNDDSTVCIEGIEDVDILAPDGIKAIQCKYYEGTKCTPSVIGEAVRPMLQHYSEHKDDSVRYTYRVFGHYKSGQDCIPDDLDIDFLKNRLLSYTNNKVKHRTHIELGLSDQDLTDFIERIELLLDANTYEEQIEEIVSQIVAVLHCNEYEARFFYYNNAVSFVKEVAVKKTKAARTVSKKKFLEAIGNKKHLFDQWYIEYVGFEKYYRAARKQYFSQNNISPKNRFFLIECDEVISDFDIAHVVMKVSDNWSRLSQREQTPFCPFLYLYGLSVQRLMSVKKILLDNDFHIWDGHEYKDAEFSPNSLVRPVNYHIGVKARFINKSTQINEVLDLCSGPKEIYQFYIDKPYYTETKYVHRRFQIRSTDDVLKII